MKNRWHTLIAVLALGAFTSIADASPPPRAAVFPPVDQAARDPAFLDFLENLRTLVRARDADAVAAHADPDIKLSFGGAYGRESFHQSLSENPTFGGASYWQELQQVLDLGGVFDAPDAFCTPYIFCLPIPDCATCDPYETLVAVEANAPIHAAPDAGSKIVATVSYAVVTMIDNTTIRGAESACPARPRRRSRATSHRLIPLPHRLPRVFPDAARRQLANDPFHRRRLTGGIGIQSILLWSVQSPRIREAM